ncbi:DUF2145 domain-containing protein [Aquincola sp. MAHUQ-54]|uniref:DUF2145 domain-containing protein n=1 Tax=Aquincola agrisoli TaxID=3119538 RepID=A0AAW9QBG4_9BURK
MRSSLRQALVLAAGLAGCVAACNAASAAPLLCDRGVPMTAAQQDRLLRFAAIVKQALDGSGREVALVARSGLDLQRFGIRYSHAGVSLQASGNGPWSVRQLYFACEEGRPRLYDQGMAGFVLGTSRPEIGYISAVLLPAAPGAGLARAALDDPLAVRLLAPRYSANAHAFGLRYQNCNQWVMEMLAAAWGSLGEGDDLRPQAQRWLAANGYAPEPVDVGSHLLMAAGAFVPWVHYDDHPEEDRFALKLRVSLPASIEAFVREHVPGAERIELCHDGRQAVVRRGWAPVAEGCRPEAGDEVIALD